MDTHTLSSGKQVHQVIMYLATNENNSIQIQLQTFKYVHTHTQTHTLLVCVCACVLSIRIIRGQTTQKE